MDYKKIAEKLKSRKYSSRDLSHCLVAQDYLAEILVDLYLDKVQAEMERLEEIESDETRGKPTNIYEYRELKGEY